MGEASGYTLDLYCDNIDDPSKHPAPDKYKTFDWRPSFFGTDRADAVKQARDKGWVFHRDGRRTCGRCNANG